MGELVRQLVSEGLHGKRSVRIDGIRPSPGPCPVCEDQAAPIVLAVQFINGTEETLCNNCYNSKLASGEWVQAADQGAPGARGPL